MIDPEEFQSPLVRKAVEDTPSFILWISSHSYYGMIASNLRLQFLQKEVEWDAFDLDGAYLSYARCARLEAIQMFYLSYANKGLPATYSMAFLYLVTSLAAVEMVSANWISVLWAASSIGVVLGMCILLGALVAHSYPEPLFRLEERLLPVENNINRIDNYLASSTAEEDISQSREDEN